MKKIYEKPVLVKVQLNTEEIAATDPLSSFTKIPSETSLTRTWTTIKY
ncbi:MAG: hypothetical protein LUC92_03465 [Clostridiales bacterium]|nr:hypothetical protein [Clostridiales bacterium]